jgi:DNA-binding MarR family transcriptional regulator
VSAIPGYDAVLNAPVRLQICALLIEAEEVEFARIREGIGTSESVLSKHAAQLDAAGYVRLRKASQAGRQRTWLALTAAGKQAFRTHVAALTRLAALAEAAE